jgi:peptidoglycan/LPS O-acetylase OafA/YrhL
MYNERIEYLDSLRGIAAMSVVIFHCMISFKIFHAANYNSNYENGFVRFASESPLKLLWSGKESVLLFFVLSGFVLSISFLNGRAFSYHIFAVKRFARLYIPYIAIMTVSVILTISLFEYKNVDGLSSAFDGRWNHSVPWQVILAYIFMIGYDTSNVNGVVWTLFHEMRISIFFPLLMFIIIKFNAIKSSVISGFVLVSLWIVFHLISVKKIWLISLISVYFKETAYYAWFFVMGAILSKYRIEVSKYIQLLKPINKTILIIGSIVLINSKWVYYYIQFEHPIISELLTGIGIVLLLAIVISSTVAQKILLVKPMLFLGKISYSLYLIHMLVLMALSILLSNFIGVVTAIALTPIVSIPVAWITYKCIEEPSIVIGRRWVKSIKKKENLKLKLKQSNSM